MERKIEAGCGTREVRMKISKGRSGWANFNWWDAGLS